MVTDLPDDPVGPLSWEKLTAVGDREDSGANAHTNTKANQDIVL